MGLPPEPHFLTDHPERQEHPDRFLSLVPQDHPEYGDVHNERWTEVRPGQPGFNEASVRNSLRWEMKARLGLPAIPEEYQTAQSPAATTPHGTCQQLHITKQGSKAYQRVKKCKDCGLVLEFEKINPTDGMQTADAQQCPHVHRDYRGTTATTYQWRCRDCGHKETGAKELGQSGRSASSASDAGGPPSVARASPSSPVEYFHEYEQERHVDKVLELMQMTVDIHRELGYCNLDLERLDEIYLRCRDRVTLTSTSRHSHAGYARQGGPPQVGHSTVASSTTTGRRSTHSAGATPSPAPSLPNPAMSSGGAMPSSGAMTSAPGQQKFAQGVRKGRTFSEVYDREPQYTKWIIGRTEKGLTKDPVLEAYVKYARDRAANVALMAIVLEDSHDDVRVGLVAVIDSGCNNTCHGSIWMRHLQHKLGMSEADAPLEPVDSNRASAATSMFWGSGAFQSVSAPPTTPGSTGTSTVWS